MICTAVENKKREEEFESKKGKEEKENDGINIK